MALFHTASLDLAAVCPSMPSLRGLLRCHGCLPRQAAQGASGLIAFLTFFQVHSFMP